MKKLLASSAIALIALSGAASAQSVLERVLGQIDNATNLASVNGTFANIAENIGGSTVATVYVQTSTDDVLSEEQYLAGLDAAVDARVATDLAAVGVANYLVNAPVANNYDLTTTSGQAAYNADLAKHQTYLNTVASSTTSATSTYTGLFTSETVAVAGLAGVNGSINNTIDGITDVTQQAIASASVSAIEYNMPTLDFGDMATTALGAVNTGNITLGVNSAVDEAKTSSTNAISAVVNQLGGSADTGAIVLNIASNMTGVNGSINNVMEEVNGSIGNLSTTALGAVNTGTIISGVDAAVAGIVGSSTGGSNGL